MRRIVSSILTLLLCAGLIFLQGGCRTHEHSYVETTLTSGSAPAVSSPDIAPASPALRWLVLRIHQPTSTEAAPKITSGFLVPLLADRIERDDIFEQGRYFAGPAELRWMIRDIAPHDLIHVGTNRFIADCPSYLVEYGALPTHDPQPSSATLFAMKGLELVKFAEQQQTSAALLLSGTNRLLDDRDRLIRGVFVRSADELEALLKEVDRSGHDMLHVSFISRADIFRSPSGVFETFHPSNAMIAWLRDNDTVSAVNFFSMMNE